MGAISDEFAATSPDGATREIDGLNRKPGLIRACGGESGDIPTDLPKHDFGTNTEPGPGVEAVLDSPSSVVKVRKSRGGPNRRTAPCSRARTTASGAIQARWPG